MKILNIFGSNLAIDLGTEKILVYKEDEGIILNEKSVVAVDIKNGEIVAIGNKAYEMIGKSPSNIVIIKPLKNGSVSDFDITKLLLKYCLDNASAKINLIQPKVVITAPTMITDIELRAIEDACIYSGAREVYIVESVLASAIGSGFNLDLAEGRVIVNFGAGNTEIAIVSLNGIVLSKNLRFGGNVLNEEIVDYIYEKYSLVIGDYSAKLLKDSIGTIGDTKKENPSVEISGRDALSGMPVTIDIFASDVKEAIYNKVNEMVNEISYLIEKNPPELSKDILKNGIYITGGGSMLQGLDSFIQEKIGIKVVKSSNPKEDTINGAGEIISNLNKYKNIGK